MATPKLKTKDEDTDEEQIEDEEEAEEEADEEESNEKEIEVETESSEDEDEDEEEVVTEEVELPEDEDEEETTSKGSLLSGSTFGISNKVLLGIGLAAIVLVLILRTSEANSSTRTYESDEQVEEEIESGTDGAIEQQPTDAGGSATKFNQQAQDDAINSVFGE